MTAEIAGDAAAGDAANPRGDGLDHGHQRKAEQHGPSKPVAELGADLAVGRDTAWIVVGRPGHQARSQPPEESDHPRPGRLRTVNHRGASEPCWPVIPAMTMKVASS